MSDKKLIVFDFDETLVFRDRPPVDFSALEELKEKGVELCIASRNDKYVLLEKSEELGITEYFTYIMADFRPKYFQIRHILWNYSCLGIEFSKVVFVDDYRPNLDGVLEDNPKILCIHFGVDIQGIDELLTIV